ncbi:hypothetical protein GBAR_LOCUS19133, partial [Geodia barretti]
TASFECIINSELALPRWNINGIDYTVTRLPAGFQFESDSFSKVLTVSPVQQEMNNWCFYCFLLFVDDRVESTRAKLIIPPPIVTPTYSISSQSTVSSTLPLSTHFSTLVSKSIPLHTTPVLDNTKGSSSQFISVVAVSVAAVVVVIPLIFATIALLIYRQSKNKGKKKNQQFHVYEEVNVVTTECATVQQNVAYANPLEIKENPAYISTMKLSQKNTNV